MAASRTIGLALLGMIAGYGVWLLTAVFIISAIPVHRWLGTALLVLVALTASAFTVAYRNRSHLFSTALWWAPVLPILATCYWLAIFAD